MFTITQDEFSKIITILAENCACCVPYHECQDSTCDMNKIYNILSQHIERDYSAEEDELPF